MKAMVLSAPGRPLFLEERPDPHPSAGEIRVRVEACGVCRTDLHIVDGELPNVVRPVVPGHEIVGIVDELGPDVTSHSLGQRVGIPWLGHTCGVCSYCAAHHRKPLRLAGVHRPQPRRRLRHARRRRCRPQPSL